MEISEPMVTLHRKAHRDRKPQKWQTIQWKTLQNMCFQPQKESPLSSAQALLSL